MSSRAGEGSRTCWTVEGGKTTHLAGASIESDMRTRAGARAGLGDGICAVAAAERSFDVGEVVNLGVGRFGGDT